MNSDYASIAKLSATTDFQARVKVALFNLAVSVAQESPSGQQVADDKRHELAVRILQGHQFIDQFSFAVAQQGKLSDPTSVTDANIDAGLNSVYNAIAGVSSRDLKQ